MSETDATERIDPDGDAGPLDPGSTSVHEAMRLRPGADEVFRRFGIDACCGGDLSLEAAAEHHGVELEELLDALEGSGAAGR